MSMRRCIRVFPTAPSAIHGVSLALRVFPEGFPMYVPPAFREDDLGLLHAAIRKPAASRRW